MDSPVDLAAKQLSEAAQTMKGISGHKDEVEVLREAVGTIANYIQFGEVNRLAVIERLENALEVISSSSNDSEDKDENDPYLMKIGDKVKIIWQEGNGHSEGEEEIVTITREDSGFFYDDNSTVEIPKELAHKYEIIKEEA